MANRRIDPDVVAEIERLLRLTGLPQRTIADKAGVCHGTVGRVNSGVWAEEETEAAKRSMPAPLLDGLERRCSACGAMAEGLIGHDVCLACYTRRHGQGTPPKDDSVATDLTDEHKSRYEAVQHRAKARHEAGEKNSKTAFG